MDDAAAVTSVNCFFIRRAHRGAGVAKALLDAVVAPGTRQAAAFLYKGTLGMFERAGFQIVQRTYAGNPLVRRRVAALRASSRAK